jgi:hypothetical protein
MRVRLLTWSRRLARAIGPSSHRIAESVAISMATRETMGALDSRREGPPSGLDDHEAGEQCRSQRDGSQPEQGAGNWRAVQKSEPGVIQW